MGNKFSRLSKEVGLDHDLITSYPLLQSVKCMGDFNLFLYYRYLRSPVNKEEVEVMNCIVERFREMKSRLTQEE